MKSSIKYQIWCLLFCTITCCTLDVTGQPNSNSEVPPPAINNKRLKTVIITESAMYVSGLYFLNNIWYKNHRSVPFHFYNDLSGWMQTDKAGHMYSAYYQSYYGIKALRWAGVRGNSSIWLGGTLGILMQTPIEIFDGLYEGYGFSASDMVANTLGSTLVVGQELLWHEQRITMKFSYAPSKYPRYRPAVFGETQLQHFFTDYNGHTYWLSANIHAFFPEANLPRWLNVAVGYGADGMLSEFENPAYVNGKPLPDFKRSRQWYVSLDVNLTAIQTKSAFLRSILQLLNLLKFPAPAFECNTAAGPRFHLIYF